MDSGLRDATAIVGIGQTEFSKAAGRSETQLAAEAIVAALADAGLTTADVDGLVSYTIDPGGGDRARPDTWRPGDPLLQPRALRGRRLAGRAPARGIGGGGGHR